MCRRSRVGQSDRRRSRRRPITRSGRAARAAAATTGCDPRGRRRTGTAHSLRRTRRDRCRADIAHARGRAGGRAMTTPMTVDAARVELLLSELRLPSMKAIWPKLAAQSDKEGWPAAKLLATLAEHEAADRSRRRFERHLVEARLPPGKTLASFDFQAIPMVSKSPDHGARSGDVWLKSGANLLIFGPPGGGRSHLSAAIGLALVENGWRVLFTRSTDLV